MADDILEGFKSLANILESRYSSLAEVQREQLRDACPRCYTTNKELHEDLNIKSYICGYCGLMYQVEK